MRWDEAGYPLVLLSHRKTQFLERTLSTLRQHARGISTVTIVDDSGDREHHDWLLNSGHDFSVVNPTANLGYLSAMKVMWDIARYRADEEKASHVLLWEEDFHLMKWLSLYDMATIMDNPENKRLAQLNLQRQMVYRVERRWGYMESHQRRGYGLTRMLDPGGQHWVRRLRPFTTNPGLIRREVLDVDWPQRHEADAVQGGAEPAMSVILEQQDWHFGWFGYWNKPHTHHVGMQLKSGIGY